MTATNANSTSGEPLITSDQALQIARLNAEAAYRDLSAFRIVLVLEEDGWHIDYELKDAALNGGGPPYLVDRRSGAILWKR